MAIPLQNQQKKTESQLQIMTVANENAVAFESGVLPVHSRARLLIFDTKM